jgi:hypothetical protein
VSPPNPPPAEPRPSRVQASVDDSFQRTRTALGRVLERITPWLLELGSWIFGALIAANLVFLGALLAVAHTDSAVLTSSAALAIALPVNVTGFFLLRLARDLKLVGLEQLTMQAFQEVGFTAEEVGASAANSESTEKKRAESMVGYSYTLLMLGAVLTVAGVAAALWHVAWWIGVAFILMSVIGQFLVSRAVRTTGSSLSWRPPSGGKEPKHTAR